MDFLQMVKSRCSIRSYQSKKVEAEKVEHILTAAHVAPTAANMQPVRLIVVQEQSGLNKISKGANIFDAPLAIIVCSDHSTAWRRPFDGKNSAHIDASILTDHMMLAATELGLGTVWVCHFKPDIIKQEFNLPEQLEPINILVIGYADEVPAAPDRHTRTRIPLSELVYYEKWH